MPSISLKDLRDRLRARPDSEHIQPFLRSATGLAAAFYALLTDSPEDLGYGFSQSIQISICLIGGFITGGLAFLCHILIYPAKNHARRILGLLHDMTWCGLALYAFGDDGILIWGMYVWLVIGYAFRYGIYYLFAASATALLSFYTVAYFSPYYRDNYELMALGTFLLALVIPLYLGSLLRTLQRNLEAAREADRLKTRFLANVSHDLRTPLNVILANCEILGCDLREQRRSIRPVVDMREAANTLSEMVINLLDIAKIEAGRIELDSSPFNMVELLGRIRRFNEVSARQRGTRIYLTVDPETPSHTYGDRLRVEQILNNIVSNAVKFTESGYVHIAVKPVVDEIDSSCKGIAFSIRDTGIGMSREAVDRIFSRFEQADTSYARHYPGAGLGLSIARELTNLMNGSITVSSAPGKGSCFTVSLPLSPVPSTAIGHLPLPPPEWLLVLCSSSRLANWQRLCDGERLPGATLMTITQETPADFRLTNQDLSSYCVLVDAIDLPVDLETLPDRLRNMHASAETGCILLNAPDDESGGSSYRAYRSVCASASDDSIKRAIAAVFWSHCHDTTLAMDEETHLQTCVDALKQRTVLIADDNELNRRVITGLLEGAEIRVIEARDGHEALEKLAAHPIDIALLDVQMPGLTGVEVMRRWTSTTGADAIPLLALTADTTDQCRSECLDAGATAVIYKPVSMRSLYSELHHALAEAGSPSDGLQTRIHPANAQCGTLDYPLLQELVRSAQQPDYLPRLVDCFRTQGRQLLDHLRNALRDHDIAQSRALLHRLQGMSGAIGARPVAQLCTDTLAFPDIHLRSYAGSLIEQLHNLHHEAAAGLERFVTDLPPPDPVGGGSHPALQAHHSSGAGCSLPR